MNLKCVCSWLAIVFLVLFMQLQQILIVLQCGLSGSAYHQGKESNIGAEIFADWGVVPGYVVLLSVFSFVSCGWFVMKSGQVSAFVECFLIWSRLSTSESTRRMLFDMEGRLHIIKHSKNADTGTFYTTNNPQLKNKKTDNGTTYSGTTPHLAKMSAPVSDTDSLPWQTKALPDRPQTQKNFLIVTQSKSVTAAWITLNRSSTTTINAF